MSDNNRYFIRLAYDGTRYNGWQSQKNAPSVQDMLTGAMKDILARPVSMTGCGRTDTGVHAREFYAHFDFPVRFTLRQQEKLKFRLNRYLPGDIAVFGIFPVPGDLHSRFSATSRTYDYWIHEAKDPFLEGRSWFIYGQLNLDSLNEGAEALKAYDDFTSFARLHASSKTNICRIGHAGWERRDHRLIFTVTADRFLRNMVRALVGTMVNLGKGKISIEEFHRIIRAKDRSMAGQSAPAHGLYLAGVEYPGFIDGRYPGLPGDVESKFEDEIDQGHDGIS